MFCSIFFRAQSIRTPTLTKNLFKTNPLLQQQQTTDENHIQNQELLVENEALKKHIIELESQIINYVTEDEARTKRIDELNSQLIDCIIEGDAHKKRFSVLESQLKACATENEAHKQQIYELERKLHVLTALTTSNNNLVQDQNQAQNIESTETIKNTENTENNKNTEVTEETIKETKPIVKNVSNHTKWRLVGISKAAESQKNSSFMLKIGENTIGNSIESDFQILSTECSQIHCIITVSDDGVVTLSDKSTSGTYVNQEQQLQNKNPVKLEHDDIVCFGSNCSNAYGFRYSWDIFAYRIVRIHEEIMEVIDLDDSNNGLIILDSDSGVSQINSDVDADDLVIRNVLVNRSRCEGEHVVNGNQVANSDEAERLRHFEEVHHMSHSDPFNEAFVSNECERTGGCKLEFT